MARSDRIFKKGGKLAEGIGRRYGLGDLTPSLKRLLYASGSNWIVHASSRYDQSIQVPEYLTVDCAACRWKPCAAW